MLYFSSGVAQIYSESFNQYCSIEALITLVKLDFVNAFQLNYFCFCHYKTKVRRFDSYFLPIIN